MNIWELPVYKFINEEVVQVGLVLFVFTFHTVKINFTQTDSSSHS